MSGEIRACRRAGAGRVVGLALIMNVGSAAAADVVSDEMLASQVDELNKSAVEGNTRGKIVVADRSPGSPHIVAVVPPERCTCD